MKISYVLPVYNCVSWISQTIESLLNQKYKDFEIIIIDDGSDDGLDFLKEEYFDEKIFWYFNDKRRGGAYSRNIGNRAACGEIIAVCDAGDVYPDNRGIEIVKFFKENPEKDIVYSNVQICDAAGNVLGVQKAVEWDGNLKPPISHPTVAYRSNVIKSIKYHEESLNTDFYEFFMIDAFVSGFNFGIIEKVLCTKMDLRGSSSGRDIPKSKEEKRKKYEEYNIKIPAEMV